MDGRGVLYCALHRRGYKAVDEDEESANPPRHAILYLHWMAVDFDYRDLCSWQLILALTCSLMLHRRRRRAMPGDDDDRALLAGSQYCYKLPKLQGF